MQYIRLNDTSYYTGPYLSGVPNLTGKFAPDGQFFTHLGGQAPEYLDLLHCMTMILPFGVIY